MLRRTALLTLALAGCSPSSSTPGGDSGSALPEDRGGLSVSMGLSAARHSGESPVTTDSSGASITLDAVTGFVHRIDLTLPDGQRCGDLDPETLQAPVACDGEDTVRVSGPWAVDLLRRSASPSLDGVTVPALSYRRVDVRFDEGVAQDGTVVPHGLVVSGSVDGTAFTLRLDLDENARFEQPGGIDAEAAAQALLLLDVDQWFAGVDLAGCVASTGGGELDEDSSEACDDLEDAVEDAVKRSGRLDDDENDDADDDEDDDDTGEDEDEDTGEDDDD